MSRHCTHACVRAARQGPGKADHREGWRESGLHQRCCFCPLPVPVPGAAHPTSAATASSSYAREVGGEGAITRWLSIYGLPPAAARQVACNQTHGRRHDDLTRTCQVSAHAMSRWSEFRQPYTSCFALRCWALLVAGIGVGPRSLGVHRLCPEESMAKNGTLRQETRAARDIVLLKCGRHEPRRRITSLPDHHISRPSTSQTSDWSVTVPKSDRPMEKPLTTPIANAWILIRLNQVSLTRRSISHIVL